MSLTTIPIKKEMRDKLKEFASKSESWNDVISRLYENAITTQNAELFFSGKSMDANELIRRINKW